MVEPKESEQEPRVKGIRGGGIPNEFILGLRLLLIRHGYTRPPSDLHKLFKRYDVEGAALSRAWVYAYFRGDITPQLPFVRSIISALEEAGQPLSEEERVRLMDTYFESY